MVDDPADEPRGPYPTGAPPEEITLEGRVFPWSAGMPVLLSIPGSKAFYLPCFDSPDLLVEVMDEIGVTWESIKLIQDGTDFFTSVLEGHMDVKIIVDLHFVDGKIRFREVASQCPAPN